MDRGQIVGERAGPRAVELLEASSPRDPVEVAGVGLPFGELRQDEDFPAAAEAERGTAPAECADVHGPHVPRQRAVVLVGAQQDPRAVARVLVPEGSRADGLEHQRPGPGRAVPGDAVRDSVASFLDAARADGEGLDPRLSRLRAEPLPEVGPQSRKELFFAHARWDSVI